MVLTAHPRHRKREVIGNVVTMGFRVATDDAGLPEHFAGSDGVFQYDLCVGFLGVACLPFRNRSIFPFFPFRGLCVGTVPRVNLFSIGRVVLALLLKDLFLIRGITLPIALLTVVSQPITPRPISHEIRCRLAHTTFRADFGFCRVSHLYPLNASCAIRRRQSVVLIFRCRTTQFRNPD